MELLRRYYPFIFGATLVGAGIYAWWLGYAQEDAYISFRYAQNLLHGHGLTFNPGEAPVEGYTNFLWVLWAAFLGLFTEDFPVVVRVSAAVIWVANLWLLHRIANRYLSWLVGLLAVVALGFNGVLASGVATGLETPLATFWVSLGLFYWLEAFIGGKQDAQRVLAWSLAAVAGILTRPDLGLPLGTMGLFWLIHWLKVGQIKKLILWLPAGLILLLYLYWKWSYFGDLLPNTFYAKSGGSIEVGTILIILFTLSTGWLPFAIPPKTARWVPVLAWGAWLLYWMLMGGDYMGFRVMLPITSIAFFIAFQSLQWAYFKGGLWKTLSSVAGLWMVFGLILSHFWPNWIQNSQRIQFRTEMKQDAEGPEGLMAYASALTWSFGQDTSLRMATGAAGIVPFFTRYHTLDMMGLTNRQVATQYQNQATMPGHGRFAHFDWVMEQGAQIVVGRWIELKDSLPQRPIQASHPTVQLTLPGFSASHPALQQPRILWLHLPQSPYALAVIVLRNHPSILQAETSPHSRGIMQITPLTD